MFVLVIAIQNKISIQRTYIHIRDNNTYVSFYKHDQSKYFLLRRKNLTIVKITQKKSKKKNMNGNVTSSIYENRQNEFQIGLMDVVALKVPFALKLLEGDYSNLRYNN